MERPRESAARVRPALAAIAQRRWADAARLWAGAERGAGSSGETAGNEALTSWTGVALVPLLGLAGLSGVVFGQFWRAHLIVGLLLVPVLGFKLTTTTYRALRYYLGSRAYRAAGPPEWPARILGPFLVIATAVAMVSGVVMWRLNNEDRPWSTIHTDSVVVMGALVALHLLWYLPQAVHAAWQELGRIRRGEMGAGVRAGMVVAVLCVGIAVGFALQTSTPFPVHAEHERPHG